MKFLWKSFWNVFIIKKLKIHRNLEGFVYKAFCWRKFENIFYLSFTLYRFLKTFSNLSWDQMRFKFEILIEKLSWSFTFCGNCGAQILEHALRVKLTSWAKMEANNFPFSITIISLLNKLKANNYGESLNWIENTRWSYFANSFWWNWNIIWSMKLRWLDIF